MGMNKKVKTGLVVGIVGMTLIGSGTFASQALKTIDSLRSSLTNTETKVQNYVDNVTQRMSELNGQIQNLTETKLSLESQITTLTGERDDLQTQLNNANGTNTELQNQIEGLNTQISNLQTELENAQTEYEKLQGEYDALVLENGNVENHYSNMVDSANELGQIHESNIDAILEGGAVEELPESGTTTPVIDLAYLEENVSVTYDWMNDIKGNGGNGKELSNGITKVTNGSNVYFLNVNDNIMEIFDKTGTSVKTYDKTGNDNPYSLGANSTRTSMVLKVGSELYHTF